MQIVASWRVLASSVALSSILLAGCGGGDSTAPAKTGPETAPSTVGDREPEVEAPADVPAKIDIAAVRNDARTAMFVPAPTEFQAALKESAPDVDIRKLVKDSGRTLEGKNSAVLALETGVRISNVLMSVHTGDKAAILARMRSALEGLRALKAPDRILKEVEQVIGEYEGGTLTDPELGPAFDVLAERINDDLQRMSDPNTATLVQAGGWVQGAHLLSTALSGAAISGDAAALLHQPTVLAYFLGFLKESGPGRAGDPQVAAVITEMEAMQILAAKPELSADDVQAVATHTGNILAKF
jgi:hypothetical protein